jgi:predicted ester cyclase
MSAESLVRRYFEEVFNEARADVCDELVAPRYVEHAIPPFASTELGEVDGPSHTRSVGEWLRAQFPDLCMTVEAVVEDADMVAVRVLSEGTNLGPLNGAMPPTGKSFRAYQSHWYRIEDGQLAEHWAVRDDLTTMVQLG